MARGGVGAFRGSSRSTLGRYPNPREIKKALSERLTPSQMLRTCAKQDHVFEMKHDMIARLCKCGFMKSSSDHRDVLIIHDFHTDTFGLEMTERNG